MIETIAVIVGATVTSITCASLWLVSAIDKRERADCDPKPTSEQRVRSYHSYAASCALCGQDTHYLTLKVEGDNLRYSCGKCQGSYLTKARS